MQNPFLELALALALMITAAKAGGYLSYRLGQPSVLGELFVGLLLGPSVINLFHLPFFTDEHLPEIIHELAEIGVLLLMFLAGIDLHITDLARSGRVAALAGTMGVVFPLVLGSGLGLALGLPVLAAIFIGLILSATSVSISAQTLMELKVLRSRVGVGLLGAAVFDDVLVVLALSIFLALVQPGSGAGWLGVAVIALRMVLFLGLGIILGFLILPRLSRKVSGLPISQGLVAFSVVVILIYGVFAEVIGSMAAITGAFLAGLVLAQSPVRDRIQSGISSIAYGLFVPIFFINVGLSANARDMVGDSLVLLVGMFVVAFIGKVLGSGWGASLGGFNRREALQLGVGMLSRGEVGLIVASVGVSEGIIGSNDFSAVVGVVILTTLLTPPLLRIVFRQPQTLPESQADGGKEITPPVAASTPVESPGQPSTG